MPSGKPAQIKDALFSHAALLATTGPTLPISWPEPGEPFVVPESGKYLAVRFFPNVPAWQGLTAGKMDQGLLTITVVWPKNQGLIAPAEVVDQVMTHFAKNTNLYSGSTKVTIYDEPREGQQLDDPDLVETPVIIAWKA